MNIYSGPSTLRERLEWRVYKEMGDESRCITSNMSTRFLLRDRREKQLRHYVIEDVTEYY